MVPLVNRTWPLQMPEKPTNCETALMITNGSSSPLTTTGELPEIRKEHARPAKPGSGHIQGKPKSSHMDSCQGSSIRSLANTKKERQREKKRSNSIRIFQSSMSIAVSIWWHSNVWMKRNERFKRHQSVDWTCLSPCCCGMTLHS